MTAYPWEFHGKHGEDNPDCTCSAWWRHYQYNSERVTPNGLEIVSVTTALSILDKSGPLMGYAANTTAEAAWTLGTTKGYRFPRDVVKYGIVTWPGWRRLLKDIKERELDHESKTDEAALRGTTVHTMFEDWVNHRKAPNIADHPLHWHGYIQAVARWIMDMANAGHEFEVAEVIVGSAEYGYAGTCDTVAVTVGKDGKRVRWDLKTSKQCYARSHFRQLAAYELAHVEMGGEPTDDMGIIVLRADGTYKPSFVSEVEWRTTPERAFLNALETWRDDQAPKAHEDAEYKLRAAREKAARDAVLAQAKAKEEAV